MWLSIPLVLSFIIRSVSADYCTVTGSCTYTCNRVERYSTTCWLIFTCTEYRTVAHTCYRNCDQQVCCAGFTGDNCEIPICFGERTCQNGGSCIGVDTCSCLGGYTGAKCEHDMDECSLGSSGCDQLCINSDGSFTCSCRTGYNLLSDRKTCYDANECLTNNGGCPDQCENTPGSYSCSCPNGYAWDGSTCKDKNECMTGEAQCSHVCENRNGSFVCKCPDGLALSDNGFKCADINECVSGIDGCQHYCNNTYGSYGCVCRSGYFLNLDQRSCSSVNQCTENNGGCDHTCLSTDGKHECRCHKGFRLNSDGKTCQDTDECIQIKGLCNGDCVNTPGSYKCNCLAGFMSTNNETRCHNIDDCLDNKCANSAICDDGIEGYTCRCVGGYTGSYCETDINECDLLNGGCEEICTNSVGSYSCTCSNNIQILSDGRSCSESSSIAYPLIPVGCHTIVIPVNQEGHLHNLTLVSTTPWYSKMANNKTTGTSGIVSVKGTLSTFPLSLFGAEVNQLNGQITSYMNEGNLNFSNTKSIEVLSKDCASSHPSPSQIFEMTRNHSFLYTFLSSLDHSKPSWIDFESTDRSIPDILDAKSEILSGRDIDSIYHCKDVPVFDDRMYAVNLFSSALNLKVLNDMIEFSKQDRENKFCIIRDIGINDASVFLNIPKDAQLSILPYQLFSTLYQLFGIEIYLNGIGVSVADGIKPDENIFEVTLWNGDHFFTFRPFSSSDIWITGESTIDVFGGIIDMKGDITVYISVPDPNTVFTTTLLDRWDFVLALDSYIGYDINYGDFSFTFAPISSSLDVFISLGDSDSRIMCGENADPPGLFFTMNVQINPFKNIPMLEEHFDLDITATIHAFFMIGDDNVVTSEQRIQLQTVVDDLKRTKNTIQNHFLALSFTYANNVSTSTFLGKIQNLTNLLNESDFVNRTATRAAISRITREIEISVKDLNELGYIIVTEVEVNIMFLRSADISHIEGLKMGLKLLDSYSKTLVSMLSTHFIESLKWKTGFGLRFRGYLNLVKISAGYQMEMVYSESDLFGCSRFNEIADYFQGEPSFKVLSVAEATIKFKKHFDLDVGRGIGFGVSLTSGKFIYRIHGFASFFDMAGITADIFITNEGLYTYIQGNIFDIFFAELDVFVTGIGPTETPVIRIMGRFAVDTRQKRQIQHDTKSFTGSYRDGLVKAVEFLAEETKDRLDDMKEAVEFAENGLVTAKNWLMDRLDDLTKAKSDQKKCLSNLDKAKEILRKARGSFEVAISRLSSAQRAIDNLCKIKKCSTICIPGIKCNICFFKVWFIKIPYPCCSFTSCMLRVPDPICLAANALCFIVRQAAYLVLEVAKSLIRLPMLALDAARIGLTVAQVAVGEADIVTGLAEVAKITANAAFEAAHDYLQSTKRNIEMQRDFIELATPIVQALVDNVFSFSIDVRNCSFQLVFQFIEPKVFEVGCEVNILSSGWRAIRFKLDFNNIAQSLWEAAKSTGRTILLGGDRKRRRRESAFMISAKAHTLIRKIRSTKELRSFNISNIHFENSTEFTNSSENEYDFRVSIFVSKCNVVHRHQNFLEETLVTLNNISAQAKTSLDTLSTFDESIRELDIDKIKQNVTSENIGLNISYGVNYNLSKEEIDSTVDNGKQSISLDPTIIQVETTVNSLKHNTEKEIQSMQSHGFADQWIYSLENITRSYYNTSECAGFRDCVLFLIGEIMELYEEERHANSSAIKSVLLEIEDDLFGIVKNTSFDIIGIYERTLGLKHSLKRFSDLNIYCAKPPTFISTPHNITSKEGGKASFVCKVSSDPEPEFWWFKSGKEISNQKTYMLTLLNISVEDEASYQCVAGNIVANISSPEVFLFIKEEISLCEINNGGCEQVCSIDYNTTRCSCFLGYQIHPSLHDECVDIDECASGNHDCEQLCNNTYGSYRCSCKDGYFLEADRTSCTKILDECEKIGLNCSQTAGCMLSPGPSCYCGQGLVLTANGTSCDDIDECKEAICDQGCQNTIGSFECLCDDGFEKDTDTTCKVCSNGFWGPGCSNPCACENARVCDGKTGCVCEDGWEGEFCSIDINECLTIDCEDPHAECWNFEGFYMCMCSEGFKKDDSGTCVDFVDCTGLSSTCNQLCFETREKQSCSCLDGYYLGNDNSTCIECPSGRYGFMCSDICECSEINTESCSTINGECKCLPGWSGALCDIDIDECSTGEESICPTNSRCINTDGEYVCICNDNYLQNGNMCVEAVQETTSMNVTLKLDVTISDFDISRTISVEYDMMFLLVELALHSAYSKYLNSFNVKLWSIRNGSINAIHRIVTEKKLEYEMYAAILSFENNTSIYFNGSTVEILSVYVNEVPISKGSSMCDIANAVSKCSTTEICILREGRHECVTKENSEDTNERHVSRGDPTIPVIIGSGMFFVLILMCIVIAYVLRRNNRH